MGKKESKDVVETFSSVRQSWGVNVMKCPSCGNYAKSELAVFFGLSVLRFKCQFCNLPLRGNGAMIFIELLSIAAFVAYVFVLMENAVQLAPMFGDLTFPLFGIVGIIFIRIPAVWMMLKFGRYTETHQ
jgi:hypothetical protein